MYHGQSMMIPASTLPMITIAMPCLNEERYIESCVRDVLAQDYPRERIEIIVADAEQRQVEILGQEPRDLFAQHGLVPFAQFGQLVVGDPVGPAFGLVEMAEPDHRHLGQPEHGRGQHPAMARDQFAIVSHHAGDGPTELGHAGGDLRHLLVAMHLGIAGIGAQPGNRPSFDLARREDEVHGMGLRMWRMGNEKCPRGGSSGRNSSMIKG